MLPVVMTGVAAQNQKYVSYHRCLLHPYVFWFNLEGQASTFETIVPAGINYTQINSCILQARLIGYRHLL